MAIIWNNIITWPNRVMARYLRRQGWVCFYLEEQNRECRALCWMREYQAGEKAGR